MENLMRIPLQSLAVVALLLRLAFALITEDTR
jgi:hypothetical protein